MSAIAALASENKVTPEDYLRREREAPFKNEYLNGEILAMSGGKPEHSRIGMDLLLALGVALEHTGCELFSSDQRVRVAEEGPYFYPDATVVCGTAEFFDGDNLMNPVIIVEVLSPSTRAFDRDQKFRAYRRIPSLRHYILVATDEIHVEHWERRQGELWTLVSEQNNVSNTLTFSDPAFSVPIAQIYRRVRFDTVEGVNA